MLARTGVEGAFALGEALGVALRPRPRGVVFGEARPKPRPRGVAGDVALDAWRGAGDAEGTSTGLEGWARFGVESSAGAASDDPGANLIH